MTSQTVSVIIPTYNRANSVQNAIESVISQDYRPLEIIVVDDASTDETSTIISKYKSNEIEYIRLETNSGPATARNVGICIADGNYISFLDSDDEYLPGRIGKVVDAFETNGNDCIGVCHDIFIRSVDGRETIRSVPNKITFGDIRRRNHLSMAGIVFRADVIEKIGMFDENFPTAEDYDLFLRALRLGHVVGLNEPLAIVNQKPGSRSTDIELRLEGQRKLVTKHDSWLHRERLARHKYAQFFLFADQNELQRARRALLAAIRTYPYDPLYYYHLVFSVGGKFGIRLSNSIKSRVKNRI